MNVDLLKKLIANLISVSPERHFVRSVARSLDNDEKKEEMIKYIQSNSGLSTSDIYRKELEINETM